MNDDVKKTPPQKNQVGYSQKDILSVFKNNQQDVVERENNGKVLLPESNVTSSNLRDFPPKIATGCNQEDEAKMKEIDEYINMKNEGLLMGVAGATVNGQPKPQEQQPQQQQQPVSIQDTTIENLLENSTSGKKKRKQSLERGATGNTGYA